MLRLSVVPYGLVLSRENATADSCDLADIDSSTCRSVALALTLLALGLVSNDCLWIGLLVAPL